MVLQKAILFIRSLLPKLWVVTVDGVQISYANRASYFVQIGDRRAEVIVDIAAKSEAVIYALSLKKWNEPAGLSIDAADKDKIIFAMGKFLGGRGYRTRLATEQDFVNP